MKRVAGAAIAAPSTICRMLGRAVLTSSVYPDSRKEVRVSESEVRRSASKGTTLERDRNDVLDAARPLPPDADVLIEDLTEDEDRLFQAAILEA
jgi:hypothetical protein